MPTRRSTLRRNEAVELEKQAAKAESRAVPQSGDVDGDSFEDLIRAATGDPFTIAPPAHVVHDWAEVTLKRAREEAKRHMRNGESATRFAYRLRFTGSSIDEKRSCCRPVDVPLEAA